MAASLRNFGIGALNAQHIIFKAVLSNNRRFVTMSESLNSIPQVDIDDNGIFKYILIKISDDANNASKFIVRGYARAHWHADIYDEVNDQLKKIPGIRLECLGGGRISHEPNQKTLKVYDISQAFGKADHKKTADILKKKYSDYTIKCEED